MAINLNELQELLNQAQSNGANEREIRKSLTRIENLIGNVQQEVVRVYEMLDGAASAKPTRAGNKRGPVERDAEAPYGRRKDGTPMKPRGRAKASEDGNGTGELELGNSNGEAIGANTEARNSLSETAADIQQRIEATMTTPGAKGKKK
jgi:hypothetical protein